MKFERMLGAFFRALSRTFGGARSAHNSAERIEFSDRFYLAVPRIALTMIFVTIDAVNSTKLSVNEAREIFESIKSALRKNGVTKINLGELSWKTDASDEYQVTISFNGPSGSVYTVVERADVAAAIADFKRRFGLT
jgi:hypothetical protein